MPVQLEDGPHETARIPGVLFFDNNGTSRTFYRGIQKFPGNLEAHTLGELTDCQGKLALQT